MSLSWATGDEGTEGPGKGDRFEASMLMDVGREGALMGRESVLLGNSSEAMRAGGWALMGGVGAYGGAGFAVAEMTCCADVGGCCWGSASMGDAS